MTLFMTKNNAYFRLHGASVAAVWEYFIKCGVLFGK